ncbi:hypothetical protein Pyn_03412 [Prunus yedoensis var. nudiflora]|uniref:Uncharacterized protein n=1 Tax=Prunus yedoensis var. nudiflora TaxID=2094558 RepID=A0A315A731_PRUYE|nr:hypothetical protein Pyn_03412 [Prunus yedoensis var. nudiflora]
MEERVRKFLKEAYENLRNLKFVVIEEECESEGTKRLRVTIAKSSVAPSPPNVVSSNTPSREDEVSNPSTEFHQADPVNHKEVSNGNHVQIDGIIRASPLETTRVMRARADQSAHDLQAYMEERESEGTKIKHVHVPSVALSPPNALPKISSREGEPSNSSIQFDQAYLLNHVELSNGSPVLMDGVHGANPLAATMVREREAYQSAHEAYMEECDLINEIPECSNYEDLVTSLALMRARMSFSDKIVSSTPSSSQMVPFEARVDRELHEQLYKKLKAIVSKSTEELRSRELNQPIEEGTSSTTNGIIGAEPMNSYVAKDSLHNPMKMGFKRRRVPATPAGAIFVDYNLPEDLTLDGLPLEELVPREETFAAGSSQRPPRQFSLAQRLKGWKIVRKQRRTGRCDLYFIHQGSNTLLRSYVEVVNFILYEVRPPKPTPKRKLLKSYEPAYKSCRIIRKSYQISEKEVREFLRSSYENLLNYKEDPSPSTDANTPVDNERIAPGLQIDLNLPAGEAEGGEEPPVEEAEGGEKEASAEEAEGGEEAEY